MGVRSSLTEKLFELVIVGVAESPAALTDVGTVVGGFWGFGDEDYFFLGVRSDTRMGSSW